FRGVTAKSIRIVRRGFPDTANSQAASAIAEQAGFASADTAKQVRDVFIPYFNKMYELYGRTVEWVDYESENGNSTEEAQSRGREGACADATKIEKEIKAFAVRSSGDQFGECAAEHKMIVFQAAAYFPESFYRKNHPYLWNTAMECERIIHQVFEYTDKRLAARKAKWAGDPVYQTQNRKFAIYIPDNDGYQRCGNIFEQRMKQGKAGGLAARYNYQLDISRFPDQAAQGMVQFKAAGVTTVIQTCDPYSTLFMTQAAKGQNYFPEWQIIGVALQDTDNAARLYDQDEVRGHLFGLSQLGATTKLIGKTSEPGRLYKLVTGNDIPEGTDGGYFGLVQVYNMLQAAGPNLTPDAIAAGAKTITPGGAPDYAAGYWSYADGPDGTPGAGDHTMIDDSREVFWVAEPGTDTTPAQSANDAYYNGPDGNNGTYKETYGGRRFRNNEWSEDEPPIYPKH
ncbi:MAG: hypothetical protein LC792_06595, partial [Actinobacteria bacterium]|nr:hypothetical protein [Actinomycetota bacterium]